MRKLLTIEEKNGGTSRLVNIIGTRNSGRAVLHIQAMSRKLGRFERFTELTRDEVLALNVELDRWLRDTITDRAKRG